jgi:uncharacterized protein
MKKFLILFLALITGIAHAQDFPKKSSRLVNDYTNTLSGTEQQTLEQKLIAYDDSTSTQVAIVVVQDLGGYEVQDYAVRLAESWGIGQKGTNNGVLILASIGDRKITIQAGYGMEGVLPDAICKRIIEQEIKPAFKQGNFYQGFDDAINAIALAAKGEYKAVPRKKNNKSAPGFVFVIIVFIVMLIIFSIRNRGGGTTYTNRGRG